MGSDLIRWEQFALACVGLGATAERLNRIDELIDIPELPVHRRVT
jgi:hypothetical protein